MNYVFASSHLPEDNRPEEEEEEDEDVQPMLRAGGVRAFSHLRQPAHGEPVAPRPFGLSAPSHLPAWLTEPPETAKRWEAEADLDSQGGFAPPATAGSDTHGPIGPVSPHGAAPPAGRSLFQTARLMAPEQARPEVHDLVYRTPGTSTPRPAFQDLVHPFNGSPEKAKSQNENYSLPVAEIRGSAPKSLTAPAEDRARDEGQQQQEQATDSRAAPGGTSTSRTVGFGPNADGSGVQFLNRIQPRDESGYNNNKPPVQRLENQGSSTKNKSPEQHQKEMEAFKKAQENHEWNTKSPTLKAWENFDRAVELMRRTPEGRAVWDRLNNAKGRSFHVMMVKNNGDENIYPELMRLGIRLRQDENGRYAYVTTVNGKEQHVILLLESAMSGHTLKPDGTINPDAESLEHVWHELYHASELHPSGGIDPLKVGTSSPTDWKKDPTHPDKAPTIHLQAHERRAVRFENIIRRRNGGTRIKNKYGGTRQRNPDGTSSMVNQVDVTDPVPPRPPHLPPLKAVP